jgi:hypothetical protein
MEDVEREPMYDVEQLDYFKQLEYVDLIVKLLGYTKELENKVIDLRIKVNRMTPKDPPYHDIRGHLYEVFDDHPIYKQHKDHIELFYKY